MACSIRGSNPSVAPCNSSVRPLILQLKCMDSYRVFEGGHYVGVPVIIETVNGNGYRATGAGGLSVGLIAEGATAAEAIDRLAEQVRTRVNAGAKLAELSVDASEAPWKEDAGYLRDDPLFEAWREAMETYRRNLDEDPDAL